MSDPDGDRVDLAARVSDGDHVDWTEALASARSEAERKFFDRLRAVADIARTQLRSAGDDVHESIHAIRPGGEAGGDEPLQWGPLRILEKIGHGSFGDVYRAHDPRLDREVALKLLRQRPGTGQEPEIIEEARLMARVRHPNVVTIYGAERMDGRTGIWMELLDPQHLGRVVRSRGPLAVPDAVRTVAEVAAGVAAIHAAGLLHRDVKPQNVLRNPAGVAVLTDFGTGIEGGAHSSPIAGTPLYVAPEILKGSQAAPTADVYSLGVLLYYLLSGRHPIEAQSLDGVREAHRTHAATPLSARGRFPAQVRRIVARATEPDPSRRVASAETMERALRSVIRQWPQRSIAAAALLIAVVAIGLALAWNVGTGSSRDRSRALVKAESILSRGMRMGSLAPDGRSVLCSGPRNPLAICHVDGDEISPLSVDELQGVPDGAFSVFSPDGRQIVYMRRLDARSPLSPLALHVMNVDGSGDHRIFEPRGQQWFLRPGAWTAHGNLIVGDLKEYDGSHRLVFIEPESGTLRVLREFRGDEPVETFSISADGRFLVYDYRAHSNWRRDLLAVDTVSGESWTLIGGESDELAPAWSPDASRVFFTSDRAGTMGIWMQPVREGRARGEPELIMDTGRDLFTAAGIADRGKKVLYLRRTGGFDGYRGVLDLSGGTMSVRRLSSRALDVIAAPDWSPDGNRLAYLASPARLGSSQTTHVVVQDVRSTSELEWPIGGGGVHQISLRWWPDGKSVLIRRAGNKPGAPVVELREADTGRVIDEIPIAGASADVVPTHDGAGVIYTTGSAVRELRLADMQDSALMIVEKPWQIVQSSGLAVSGDGQQIAVTVMQERPQMLRVRTYSRSTRQSAHVDIGFNTSALGWADPDRLLLATTSETSGDSRVQVLAYVPATAETHGLGLRADQPRHFRLHPDGRQFLFSAGSSRLEYWWLMNADRN